MRTATRLLVSFGMVAAAIGCGKTSVSTVTSPTLSRCDISASSNPSSFPAGGGQGAVTVNTNRDCSWTAQSSAGWVAIHTPREGQGEGRVTYSVAENDRQQERRATLTVNDTALEVFQAAAPPPPPPAPNPAPAPNPGPTPNPGPAPSPAPAPNPAPAPDPPPAPSPTPVPNPPPAPDPPPGPTPAHEKVELSGEIQSLDGSCPDLTFWVSGTRILTSQQTAYTKGAGCRDLQRGVDVKVKGRRQTDGSVLADKIERD